MYFINRKYLHENAVFIIEQLDILNSSCLLQDRDGGKKRRSLGERWQIAQKTITLLCDFIVTFQSAGS